MKLIHTYGGYQVLKHWQYDHTDEETFIEEFKEIDSELSKRLCDYLKHTNQVVDVIECYDGQSGWRGFDFNLDGQNLSLNGYCFSGERLDEHLKGKGY